VENETTERDLRDRLDLIENMIAEGRRKSESWGWAFVLWGLAYYVAFFWGNWGHFAYAWPVTVIAASLLTMLGFWRNGSKGRPNTTLGRAIAAVWWTTGLAMFILYFSLAFSGRLADYHLSVAIAGAMLGAANAACAAMLRWMSQFLCAIVWWSTCVAASFGSASQTTDAFLGAIFLCQIVFGIYAMTLEARRRRQHEALHA
jgi:hypothetical protein